MEDLISTYIGENAVFVPIVVAILTQIVKGLLGVIKGTSAWIKTVPGQFLMDMVPILFGCGAAYLPGITAAPLGMKWMYGILLGAAAVWVYKFSSKIPGLDKLFKSSADIGTPVE